VFLSFTQDVPVHADTVYLKKGRGKATSYAYLQRLQLARMRLTVFSIVLQFLQRPSTALAYDELQQRCQEPTRGKTYLYLCACFDQGFNWTK
jgi:hypothetical protein